MFDAFKRLFGEGSAPADEEGGEMSEREDREPEPTPQPVDPAGDLSVRLDELETELDRNESSIRAIRSSQEEMNEAVQEVNDRVRRLLGVYDQLAATDNPFAADREEDFRFGVVGAPEAATTSEPDEPAASDETTPEDGAAQDAPDTVSFDDLRAAAEEGTTDDEGAVAEERATDEESEVDPGEDTTEDHPEPPRPEPLDTLAEVPADADAASEVGAEAADATADEARGPPEGANGAHGATTEEWPTLATLPDGYAADALVLEWLAGLVEAAGPAGALKALAYYESVGWLEGGVKYDLEDYIGGPDLDVHVDPSRPNELTAEDHAESYEYVLTLRALRAMD